MRFIFERTSDVVQLFWCSAKKSVFDLGSPTASDYVANFYNQNVVFTVKKRKIKVINSVATELKKYQQNLGKSRR